jgi:surfactin synthase thioesterase subunit
MSETCLKRISEVAELAVEALGSYFDTSFALFGHSLKAVVAYEVAQTATGERKCSPNA